ncbi:uncharacterized protein EDB91DRAFT_1254172 [Suillus paluster]|uniref:uncharacterized protein n=1 Tax=Suillus paluster TaxID=48578 RepID=UPI001B871078|nr:uncharacterized protein EDB91DRAFT_1254172 [Suillus paluster]KAG1726801.1 hypothetical protein EDB91DRAFT_1254172 [Suillus paluster]
MNVSPDSEIEISFWISWALTVTHEVSEYTEQKFNADKMEGDPVIPSPHLDTDLVIACDRLVDHLIKAYHNPIQMQIDIARYSKLISLKDTGHNEEREKKLLDRCPPGHEGTKFVNMPATVLDVTGAIIMWYLPGALMDTTQEEIWKASQLLTPTLERSVKVSGSWRTNEEWFGQGSGSGDITAGCINISPAWFQQGHETVSDLEVSASLKGPLSEDILKAIARPAASSTQGHASSTVLGRHVCLFKPQ